MPDQDDRLSEALQDYYRRMAQQPAPDVTGRVVMAADIRATRMRRFAGIGGGLLAAAAVAVVIAVALVNHRSPTGVTPGPAGSPTPSVTAGPTGSPTASPTNTPSAPPVAVGPAVHGFVPTDVTAISANEWWVLGYNGPTCASASCTRVLHTTDGGSTFASIPVPPVAPAQANQQAVRLRFADAADGWVVSAAGVVWATHDSGVHWSQKSGAGSATDLEASGGSAYAVACAGSNCTLERSVTAQDAWSTLPSSAGHGSLSQLNVNGAHVWVAHRDGAGGPGILLRSADGGQSFTAATICPSALDINLYAVDTSVLWATCATGTEASAFRSVDGGQHFTQVPGPGMMANVASIAGTSSANVVVADQALFHSVNGGQTFAIVENNQTQWKVVGFTTSSNGFAFEWQASGQFALWRTNDGGAHWYHVQFP